MNLNSANNNPHKKAAISFLNLVTSGKIDEVYQKYVGPNFRHHNPFFPSDANSLATGMKENEIKFPNKVLKIKNILGDGNLVAVHSHVQLISGETELAVVHIFRFSNDKIVELWDLGQSIPKDSPNKFGMF